MVGRASVAPKPRVVQALAVPLALGALLLTAASACAAETVANFDNLTAGAIVTTQYEAQDLKLGRASELGQASPGNGDCGPPTVAAEAANGPPAASTPNYAILPACASAGTPFRGTYGALLGDPRGALSVDVSNLTAGTPGIEVQVIAYNSTGQEIASGNGAATAGTWQRISLITVGKPQISYFMIRTATASMPSIGIDNLSFEQANEPTGGSSGSGGGSPSAGSSTAGGSTPPTPPTAALSLQTTIPTPGETLTLSGAAHRRGAGGSSPTAGTSTATARSTRAPARTRSRT